MRHFTLLKGQIGAQTVPNHRGVGTRRRARAADGYRPLRRVGRDHDEKKVFRKAVAGSSQ
jgi:hypothetical protein